jgi:hypothetical protein
VVIFRDLIYFLSILIGFYLIREFRLARRKGTGTTFLDERVGAPLNSDLQPTMIDLGYTNV